MGGRGGGWVSCELDLIPNVTDDMAMGECVKTHEEM